MICEKIMTLWTIIIFLIFYIYIYIFFVDIFDVSLLFVSIPGKEPADGKLILETV